MLFLLQTAFYVESTEHVAHMPMELQKIDLQFRQFVLEFDKSHKGHSISSCRGRGRGWKNYF